MKKLRFLDMEEEIGSVVYVWIFISILDRWEFYRMYRMHEIRFPFA